MERKNLKLSIIIPLYNKADSIAHTLQSVLGQNYSDFELIIVNDGSTDQSLQIVTQFSDPRIRLINQENQGVSAARNRGAQEACGEWLLFLDADDTLYPDAIQSLISLHIQYPFVAICSGNYITKFSNEKIIPTCSLSQTKLIDLPFKQRWFRKWYLRLGSFMCAKKLFLQIGGFKKNIAWGEDIYFTNKLIEGQTIAYTTSIIMCYERRYSSLSKKQFPLQQCIAWHLIPKSSDLYRQLTDAELIGKDILWNILKGRIQNASHLIIKNIKYAPLISFALIWRLWLRSSNYVMKQFKSQ
ncbi:glycosyltransferase family 2 protein [Alistipes sp.]|uniref:glycosyltransferase family 2 protein n=1 Tax=Alistipes sp. TaxID=1872444 RepID=UPI003AF4B13D